MKRYTSGYTKALRHFAIQNLPPRVASPWSSALKVALNIIQRGDPTQATVHLLEHLGIPDWADLAALPEKLVPDKAAQWESTIRGDDDRDNNPAFAFFHRAVPTAISPSASWLLLPEAPISEILQRDVDEFAEQRVDFYIPDSQTVIEIDGAQHATHRQSRYDEARDQLLKKQGISTVRITTAELRGTRQKGPNFNVALRAISEASREYSTVSDLTEAQLMTLRLVAAFRLQVALLELLLCGQLKLDGSPWEMRVRCDDAADFETAAVEDLLALLEELARLYSLGWNLPESVELIRPDVSLRSNTLCIDLSCARRWTDEAQTHRDTIFVRSDYIHRYPVQNGKWENTDYFHVESGERLTPRIEAEGDSDPLKPLLERIFSYPDFRPGQRSVIVNAFSNAKTVGILPTGQGKSLCYQLPALLQPGTTVVISPLRSLMRDQVAELHQMGIDRVASINSEDNATEKRSKMDRFAKGGYQILLVSPERFQVPEFRNVCGALNQQGRVHHAVVDEVHCLSEWGHDFRIAYLNLAKTLSRSFPDAYFIGLTATASANVITDIKNEFSVSEDDVLYRLDLRRENLQFQVLPTPGGPIRAISKWVSERATSGSGSFTSGIIFTPHVNGKRGCYELATTLASDLATEVGVFSGSRPKRFPGSDADFETKKLEAQDRFKRGELKLLCATKAFGMGVNKKDVRFTVHLGIPSSMESLYQEAGRAGRDGKPADCLVFRSAAAPALNSAFEPGITPSQLKELVESERQDSDLRAQLWLLTKGLNSIAVEFRLAKMVLNELRQHPDQTTIYSSRLHCDGLGSDNRAFAVQQAIYRLGQLGYVLDWTVLDFVRGVFAVDWTERDPADVEDRLIRLVQAYSGTHSVESLEDICEGDPIVLKTIFKTPPRPSEDVALLLLLTWSYNHFHYARRQSMKSVFELCEAYDENGQDRFRESLEAFFQIDSRTNTLHRLIDGGIGLIDAWPALLLPQESRTESGLDGTLWRKHLDQLQGMINRLLESFRGNVALDMMSGMVRLLRGEYDDIDGSPRLMAQLNSPKRTPEDRERLVSFTLAVGQHARPDDREALAKDLLQLGPTRTTALKIHSALDDQYSLVSYLEFMSKDLAAINREISNGLTAR